MRAAVAARSQEEETIVKVLLINGSPRWKGNTNRALEEAGIRLHTIPSAELSRGRGGPRYMSMPLWREDP